MANLAVKSEVKPEVKPEIKLDPADNGGRKMADIDEFEDDIDLQIPPPGAQAWLVSLPKDMWQVWNNVYKDAPEDQMIEVGKMRVYHTKPGEDASLTKQNIQIRLNQHTPQHADIPKNYQLKVNTEGYSNTVVFSEKDLPGHRSQPFGRNRYLQASKPSGIQAKSERYGGKPGGSGKPTYRTAIPKQTVLAPQIYHEASATPIEDDAYYVHIKRKWDAHVAPKSRTTYIEGVDRGMHPGVSNLSTFQSFGISARPGRGNTAGRGKKVVKEKAVRMSHADLMDALGRCFRRYKYWSMKALRTELRQPEAWIKELLEQIATLVRSGDFALNWMLKPEYQSIVKEGDDVKEELAKVESGTDMGTGDELGDDGDDVDEEFEDVKMEAPEDVHATFLRNQLAEGEEKWIIYAKYKQKQQEMKAARRRNAKSMANRDASAG